MPLRPVASVGSLNVGTIRLESEKCEMEPPVTNRKIPTTHVAAYKRVQRLKGELAMSLSRSIGSAIGTFCIDTLCTSILRPRERSLHG